MPHEEHGDPTEEELAREGEALIAAAVADVRAPQSLREGIERERGRAQAQTPFWRRHRLALAGAGIAATALAVVAIALQVGDGTTQPPLEAVYAAARLDPVEPAPAKAGGDPPVLDANVGSLEFPDWKQSFGWRAVGRRDEEVEGRAVTTVFYRNPEGARLGYAVVSGDELDADAPGRTVTRGDNSYQVAEAGDETLVTWTQEGRTCVIVAPSTVPPSNLVDLAASHDV